MHLTVTLEHRFQQTPDGAVWTQSAFQRSFWQRYLVVFEHVHILARVQQVERIADEYQRVDDSSVSFQPLPYYIGPVQYLLRRSALRKHLQRALPTTQATIMRVPSIIAGNARDLLPTGYPYAVEVLGDPWDVFAQGAVRHPLRAYLRRQQSHSLRQMCAGASAAAYVTRQTLQKRYPPRADAFTTHYSSIELDPDAFVDTPRHYEAPPSPAKLMLVGSLEQMYKGADVLIDAVMVCTRNGVKMSLTIVGDGKHRHELEARAAQAGIADCVHFTGTLPAGQAVRDQLDNADVFVLPSRTEGLPRAMIEAMARGLPCIGSTAGGIPELLPAEDMVPPGDAVALANTIQAVVTDLTRMTTMAERNLEKARQYHEDVLKSRRNKFYHYVHNQTARWLEQNTL